MASARPIFNPDPAVASLLNLNNYRTREYTAAQGDEPVLGLFPGLYSPPPKRRLPKESPGLYPALTPWIDDWATANNDQLPENSLFDYDNSDLPDDGFTLGEPEDEFNYWEPKWIVTKSRAEAAEKEKRKLSALKRKRSGPLTAAGRKKRYKQRAKESGLERVNGKFVKKPEIIIIGEDEPDIVHHATIRRILNSLAKVRDPAVAQPAAIAQAPVVDHQATVQAILASLSKIREA